MKVNELAEPLKAAFETLQEAISVLNGKFIIDNESQKLIFSNLSIYNLSMFKRI